MFILGIVADNHATVPNRVQWGYYDSAGTATNLLWNAAGPDIWINNWMHLVGTRDGSDLKFYLNGVLTESITGGNGSMHQNISSVAKDEIGSLSKSTTIPDAFWDGKIDQVASWSTALNQEQVDVLYNSGNGLAYTGWN